MGQSGSTEETTDLVHAAFAHAAAQERGEDGYLDPTTELFVMTASYLERRGWCCENGCRHCPYPSGSNFVPLDPTD